MSTVNLVLDNGATVAIEVEKSLVQEMGPVGVMDRAADWTRESFEKGIGAVAGVSDLVLRELSASGLPYDEAELEFGITFTGGADVKIVKGESSAAMKMLIRWKAGA